MSFFSRLFGRKEKAPEEPAPEPAAAPVPAAAPAVAPSPEPPPTERPPPEPVPQAIAAPAPPEDPVSELPDPDAVAAALTDRLAARWAGLAFDVVPGLADVSADWAAVGGVDPETLDHFGGRAGDIAMRWSPEPQFVRTLAAATTVDGLMESVPHDLGPTRAALGVTVAPGPMLYAVIAFAVP